MPNVVRNSDHILLLTVSPGRLGLTLNVNKNDPQNNGAVITNIHPACTFKDKLEVGDRIVTIDGQKVTKVEDLHVNKDQLRKFGIVKAKNLVAAAAASTTASSGGVGTRETTTTTAATAAPVQAAVAQQQQQQQRAMTLPYHARLQQKEQLLLPANKPQKEKMDIPKNPMVGLYKLQSGNYNIVHQHETLKNISRTDVISRIQAFIESLSQMQACSSTRNRGFTTCTCMHFLKNKPRVQLAMCHAILEYSNMTHIQKKHYTVERMRYAKIVSRGSESDTRKRRVVEQLYALPLSYKYLENDADILDYDEDCDSSAADLDFNGDSSQHLSCQEQQRQISEAFSHRICEATFLRLHNVGQHAEMTHKQYIGGDLSIITHQNTGKKRKRKTDGATEDIRSLLQALYDEYINSSECKREGDDFFLPVSISKRHSYEEWCRRRGWEPIKLFNGQYAKLADFKLLDGYYKTEENASAAEADGRHVVGVAGILVSFANFITCWNNEFPNMKTQGRVGKGLFIGDRYGSGKWDRNRNR